MNFVFNLDNVICTPAKGIRYGMIDYIDIDEAPSHAKFYKHIDDMGVVAQMYEEWKNDRQKESSKDSSHES